MAVEEFKIMAFACTDPDFFRIYIATPDGRQMLSWNWTLHRSQCETLISRIQEAFTEADRMRRQEDGNAN